MTDLAAGVLAWRDRRELVLQAGTQAVVESSRQRWFGPDFEAGDPGTAQLLIDSPPALLRELADGVQHGRYAELSGVGHLAPAEAPAAVAQLIARDALISKINQSTAFSFLPDIDRDS